MGQNVHLILLTFCFIFCRAGGDNLRDVYCGPHGVAGSAKEHVLPVFQAGRHLPAVMNAQHFQWIVSVLEAKAALGTGFSGKPFAVNLYCFICRGALHPCI